MSGRAHALARQVGPQGIAAVRGARSEPEREAALQVDVPGGPVAYRRLTT